MSGAVPLLLIYAFKVCLGWDKFTCYPVLIPFRAYPASYSKDDIIFFPPGYGGEGVTLACDLHLLAR
jgi:hypothetical protein